MSATAVLAPLPLKTIVERTLAQDDARQKALQAMQYDQVADIEQLDDVGKTEKHEVLKMIVTPAANPSVKIVSMLGDDIPSNPEQAHAEAEEKSRDVESNKQNFTLRALVNRFNLELVGLDHIDDKPTYVIAFKPKPNQPYADETEKIVNQLTGRIWISADTFTVLRTEARLAQAVSIAWFLANIPTLDFHYQTRDVSAGFAPAQVKIMLQVKALFVGFHQRQTIDMTNFRVRTPADLLDKSLDKPGQESQ